MKRFLPACSRALLLALFFSICCCYPADAQDHNVLSAAEKRQGWTLLFDGQSLNGWKTFKDRKAEGWRVVDGELRCVNEGVQQHADIMTVNTYENFELVFDWKVDKGANSGIMYMVTEKHGAPYLTGPEYQLIDDFGYAQPLSDAQKSGSNYDMHAPSEIASRPVGEFNVSRIVKKGNHVEHWLNGKKVVEYDLYSDDWKQRKEKSKWSKAPDYGMFGRGAICLQDHGGGITFRNIKIRTL